MTTGGPDLAAGARVRRMPHSPYCAAYSPLQRRFFWISNEAFAGENHELRTLAAGLPVDTLVEIASLGLIDAKELAS
jgi:hypothetical protein